MSGAGRAARPVADEPVLLRGLRGVAGVLTGGVLVLTAVVVVAAVAAARRSVEGPGAATLAAHLLAAVVVLVAQVGADRRWGARAVPGLLVVLLATGLLLWSRWWVLPG